MNVIAICEQYGLGQVRDTLPLRPGTAAQVWKLETDSGNYLLRTLAGREQGELEWAVAQHLAAKGFDRFPAILTTGEGAPLLELEGTFYQVQQYLSGPMPDPARPGVAGAMARTIGALARCMPDGLIHGDLGPWNMIAHDDGTISVIDFGAVREGDPYFDCAAALGGVINHTSGAERVRACREFLSALEADRPRLLTQLALWAQEGAARWSGVSEDMTARFYNALNWAEEHLYDL